MKDDIRVGAAREPLHPLGKTADAGIIAPPALHIGDELKVEMRGPVAVLEAHPEFTDHLAFAHELAFMEVFERVEAQVAIKGMKAYAIEMMSEDDRSAVVAVVVVEGKAVYDAIERGHDLGSCGSPDIDAKVKPAWLGFRGGDGVPLAFLGISRMDRGALDPRGLAAGAGGQTGTRRLDGRDQRLIKMCTAGIKCPVFTVAADAITCVMLMKGVVDPGGETVRVGDGLGRKAAVAIREIEDKKLVLVPIERHYGMKIGAMPVQYGDQRSHFPQIKLFLYFIQLH